MKNIYLDHSATTPVDKAVLDEMLPYFSNKYGNASSIHTFGQTAVAGVDKAREQLANFFDCEIDEIYFTSGATESNNLALKGFVKALEEQGIKKNKMHIITSLVEHDAILEPCIELEREGVEITHLQVKRNGEADIEKLEKIIKDNTVLISIMYVNSEVGSIQPIREIGKIIKKINQKRLEDWKKCRVKNRGEKPLPIYFHTDATQGVNFLDCSIKRLHVDMLSMSGHKIYGPKGVGALVVKKNTPLKAIIKGGHQEKDIRSGTYNVAGIVGLGKAVELLDQKSVEKNNKQVSRIRDLLVSEIKKNIPDIILNTDRENSTPSHAHFSFPGAEGEAALIALDMEGVAVSTGSACASSKHKASHVLLAMGIKPEIAHTSLRFTLGKYTTQEEIKKVIKILPPIIKRLREMNPLYKK